jgi:hypothetical protein
VTEKLGIRWKEVIMAWLRYSLYIYMEIMRVLQKSHRISGDPVGDSKRTPPEYISRALALGRHVRC